MPIECVQVSGAPERIPESFQLFGQTIYVHRLPEVRTGGLDCYGAAYLHENRILIEDGSQGTNMELLEQTFWHEALHFIFNRIGFDDLGENEHLVDLMGQALYQLDKTRL